MAKTLTEPQAAPTPIPAAGRKPERLPAGAAAVRTVIPRHDDGRKWPFILVHSGYWEIGAVGGKPALLPVIDVHVTMPGSQNVKQRRKGQPPDARLRDGALSEAYRTVISDAAAVYKLEVRQDDDEETVVRYYYCAWEDVTEYPDGAVIVRHQPEQYDIWRAELLKQHTVSQPHEGHLQVLTRVTESLLARCLSHPDTSGYWKRKAEILRARLSAIRPAYGHTLALCAGRE